MNAIQLHILTHTHREKFILYLILPYVLLHTDEDDEDDDR